jgi:hypothetical protein
MLSGVVPTTNEMANGYVSPSLMVVRPEYTIVGVADAKTVIEASAVVNPGLTTVMVDEPTPI